MASHPTQLQCPRDGNLLQSVIKNGIEIEYCPTCGGVWLDHGELEKLIEMSTKPQNKFGPPNIGIDDHHQAQSSNHYYHKPHKKESWLGEIFDF